MNFSTLSLLATKTPAKDHATKICIAFFLLFIVMLTGMNSFAQSTYTWNGGATASWAVAGSWSPARTTPAVDDIIVFNSGTTITPTAIPAQTIGQLLVSGNTIVNLQSAAANTLSIAGGTGVDLSVASGSQLNINGSTALTISLLTGATGSISGSMTTSSSVAATPHQILAADASALTFNNGATFLQSTNSTGSMFGTTGTQNTVIFASGSAFMQGAGSNPFGLTQPASKVVFQTGSLFKMVVNAAPSMTGRTYANFEWASAGTTNVTGGTGVTMDNLTVSSGTLGINLTAASNIKGNISVLSGQTLNFAPASATTLTFSGSTAQVISNAGTLTFGANEAVVIANTGSPVSSVTFNQAQTISGTVTVNAGSILAIGGGTLTTSLGATINGSFQINQGGFAQTGTWTYGSGATLKYNNSSGSFGENGGAYWPTTNGPANVTVAGAGGLTMNVARTVSGVFQTAAGVTNANNITANGTLQINGGGFLTGTPTYGASSTLIYNASSYTTTSNEFPVSGVKNVTVTAPSGTSTVTLDADKAISGTLAIGANTVNGGKSINAASITIGAGSLVAGTLTTSTSFTCSGASSISMTGSWNVVGFVKSTSTVNFTGTGNLNISSNFYNLTNSAGTRSITASFDVENTLLVSGGQMGVTGGTGKTLSMSGAAATITIAGGSVFGTDAGAGNDLTLNVTGTQTTLNGNVTGVNDDEKKFFNVTVNNGSTLALARGILCKYGTFSVNGTLQINTNGYINTSGAYGANAKAATYNATTGSLIYNNGGPYTTAGEWPAVSGPVNVSITAGSSVFLSGDRTVPGTLALLNNLITTGGFILTIGVSGSLTRTTGYVIGNLRRAVATGPSTTIYDIGDADGNYAPLTLNFASGTGAGMLTASTTEPNAAPAAGNPPTGSGISQANFINRSWSLFNSTATTPTYSAVFTYINPGDVVGSPNTSNLAVAKNTGGTWSNPGVASSVAPTVVTLNGLTSFGDFYLGDASCTTPSNLNYTLNTVAYCINLPITTNSPTFTGDAAISYSVSPALPTGLSLNTTTGDITGTPTVATAAADYLVTVNNACGSTTKNVNITINDNSTLSLSSAMGTDAQAVCINNAITDITYAVGGAGTGASITAGALPAGVTGSYTAGVFTISGTPTAAGNFSYTVTVAGGSCTLGTLNGTITVNDNSTLSLSSAMGTDAQAVCINNAITDITYAVGGAGTGASITAGALPAGVTGSYNAGVFTISGTPTVSGNFSYTMTVAGGSCVLASLNGTITVNPLPSASFSGLAATYCTTDAAVTLTGSPVGGTFSGTGIVGNSFDPATAGAGGPYTITYSYTNGNGCTNTSSQQVTVTVCVTTITANLKLFLQGYMDGDNPGNMKPVLINQGVAALTTETDTVVVELHDNTTYALVDAKQAVLHTDGTVSATFSQPSASYYIAIRHRNTLQTWTADPVFCTSSTALYDFTLASSNAFGGNQVEVEPGIWGFYTGDLNQDDFIDGNDFPAYDVDSYNGVGGVYVATDMNGDGFVDGNDFPVYDVNSYNGVSAIYPQ